MLNFKSMNKENSSPNKIKKIINMCVFVIILIMLIFIISALFGNDKHNILGNTIGNVINYGYTAIQGDWIYFIYPNEQNSKIGIYKIKTNGKEKQKVIMENIDDIVSINVYKDYIYFIGTLSGEYSANDTVDNKIYRVKTDGTDLEVINDNFFNNSCREIYVVNDLIYYIGLDANIYTMNLDGTDKKMFFENGAGYLGVTDKYIIYNVNENKTTAENESENIEGTEDSEEIEYVTYIMNLDGSNSRPILEGQRLYSVNIEDDYIYFTNDDKKICRTKLDSNKTEIVINTEAYNLNICDGYGYYLTYSSEEQDALAIYRVNLEGALRSAQKITDLNAYTMFINVVGEYVSYMDRGENNAFINLVKNDASESIQLYTIDYEEYYETVENKEDTNADTSFTNEIVESDEEINGDINSNNATNTMVENAVTENT